MNREAEFILSLRVPKELLECLLRSLYRESRKEGSKQNTAFCVVSEVSNVKQDPAPIWYVSDFVGAGDKSTAIGSPRHHTLTNVNPRRDAGLAFLIVKPRRFKGQIGRLTVKQEYTGSRLTREGGQADYGCFHLISAS